MKMGTAQFTFYSLLCIGLCSPNAVAQPLPAFEFKRLSRDDGLSSYSVKALNKDASGFLWIGTHRGLDRFSGVRVRTANRNPASPWNLIDDDINAIEQDSRNPDIIWVGTENGGLSRYDSKTQRFTNFVPGSSSISSKRILALYGDQPGVLWVGTDAGLNRFDQESGSFSIYPHFPKKSNTLVGDSVAVIYEPQSMPGNLFIGTTRGLCILDVSSGNFQNIATASGANAPLSQMSVTAIAEVNGRVWLGTDDGSLFRYDPGKQHYELISYSTGNGSVDNISTLTASKYSPALLWIGTQGQGLFALNTKSLASKQHTAIAGKIGSLSSPDVNAVIEDEEGTLWVGTRLGLDKVSLKKPFRPYLIARESPKSLNSSFVVTTNAAKASNGPSVMTCYSAPSQPDIVWVSLLREGLWRYHRRTGIFQRESSLPDHLNFILAIYEDLERTFWLAGKHSSLFRWVRSTNEVKPYRLVESGDLVIHQIFEMESLRGVLWVATRDLGLLKFDIEGGAVVKTYSIDSKNTSRLSSNYVWSVYESPNEQGILWLSTRHGGLNRLDTRTDSVTVFRKGATCLSNEDIIVSASTEKDLMWLGTFGGGLIQFDMRNGTCKTYSESDGLPDTDVSAIFSDQHERLWLSTSNGVSMFDLKRESFTNFTEDDGLQSNIFHYQGRYRNAESEIFLGGTRGFNIFHPDSILVNQRPSNVVITNLLVNGRPYPLVRNRTGFEPISLSFQENDLQFEFAVLDLRQPYKNRYKVKLEGAENEWRKMGNQAYERYPLLAPGSYTFRVTGSNSDGYWNKEGVAVSFKIAPPFWKAWWFWTLISVSGFGLIIGAFQYRIYQLRQIERTRKRIADDLHDDIGSKMSSIALMVDVTGKTLGLEGEQQEQFSEISDTARQVVDDLRDAIWLVDAGHDDLAALVARMKQVTNQILRGQPFHFQKPDTLPTVPLKMEQRRHLFLIYKEMLHNVMRHAQASQVEIRISYTNGQFTIRVHDDGVGFDPLSVRRGRGLTNLHTRARLLKGSLEIDSKPGDGTRQRFTVRMALIMRWQQ